MGNIFHWLQIIVDELSFWEKKKDRSAFPRSAIRFTDFFAPTHWLLWQVNSPRGAIHPIGL